MKCSAKVDSCLRANNVRTMIEICLHDKNRTNWNNSFILITFFLAVFSFAFFSFFFTPFSSSSFWSLLKIKHGEKTCAAEKPHPGFYSLPSKWNRKTFNKNCASSSNGQKLSWLFSAFWKWQVCSYTHTHTTVFQLIYGPVCFKKEVILQWQVPPPPPPPSRQLVQVYQQQKQIKRSRRRKKKERKNTLT